MTDSLEDLSLSRTFSMHDGQLTVELPPEFTAPQEKTTGGSFVGTPGATIDSKYRVIALLGEGGMGSVYRVQHLLLKKDVALKTFRTAQLTPEAWQRFQREAQAIAKLRHANIIQVYDFGISEQNFPYYTMELLVGQTLSDVLNRTERLAPQEAIRLFSLVADGMAHAHRQGIVHRDIKPANIFLELLKHGDEPKVVDFGLAKLATGEGYDEQHLTATGLIFGSPLYMSPEQSRGAATDQRTDIYSFGCSLFQTLTGAPPFVGKSALATISMHQQAEPPRLSTGVPGVQFPDRLEALIAKLLAKNPDKRYQSFEDVRKELALIDLTNISKQPLPADRASGRSVKDVGRAALERDGQSQSLINRKINIWPWVTTAVCLTGIIIGIIFGFYTSTNTKTHLAAEVLPADRPSGATETKLTESDSENIEDISPTSEPNNPPDTAEVKPGQFFLGKTPAGYKFKFPDTSIGELTISQGGREVKKAARGTMLLPQAINFKAGRYLAQYPKYFRGFQGAPIFALVLQRNLGWGSRQFAEIAKLDEEKLILNEITVKPSDLQYFDQIKHIKYFAISRTGLTGTDLVNLKFLGQLHELQCGFLSNLKPLLSKIQTSRQLNILSVVNSKVDDSQLEIISRIRLLHVLTIDNNPFTIRGLKYLTQLPEISVLLAANADIGPEVMEFLPSFKLLKQIRLDTRKWTPEQRKRLTEILPKDCVQLSLTAG